MLCQVCFVYLNKKKKTKQKELIEIYGPSRVNELKENSFCTFDNQLLSFLLQYDKNIISEAR